MLNYFNKLLSVSVFFISLIAYSQNTPSCTLDNIGLYLWMGDADSQSIGDATNDDENFDDFIGFKNYSSTAVDISGWQLFVDQNGTSSPVFTIPPGTILLPGQYFLVVADWNGSNPIPDLWFDANFTSGDEGMFEETSNHDAWAILRNPTSNQYITVHMRDAPSSGQSLPSSYGATKICHVNVVNLLDEFEGCDIVYYNSETGNYELLEEDCAISPINSDCGQISNEVPPVSTPLENVCPLLTANLNDAHTGTVPSGTTLVWFTNQNHTGTAYPTPETAGAGIYYAFYYNSTDDCYSPPSVAVNVLIDPMCYCTKPPVGGVAQNSSVGISIMEEHLAGWPQNVPNGYLVLEAGKKGLVLTRTTPIAIGATNWVEGMIIFDTSNDKKCISLYNGIEWKCIERSCNEY